MSFSEVEERAVTPLYPLFVRLEDARVVVVGGGVVAARKVEMLLECGAKLIVVAPEAVESIRVLAAEGRLTWWQRPYAHGDLEGALLAVAATSEHAVNEAVLVEAAERTMLVNGVDDPASCNCFVPAALRRGRLQVAVSTGGASPSAARELRRELAESIPGWWEPYLDLVMDVRTIVKERVPGPSRRRAFVLEQLGAPALRERIASGERPTAEQVFQEIAECGLDERGRQ